MRGSLPRRAGLVAVLAGLAGCVAVPPPQPAPLVVLPGQQKTYVQFQQDDAACRTGGPAALPLPAQAGSVAAQPLTDPNLNAQPHLAYVQCMAARGNDAVPVPQAYPYPAYTYGYTSYYPWVYGPAFWGGYGFGLGFGGYYGGYYGRGWGGYGGYGWRGGYGGGNWGGRYGGGYGGYGGHREGGGFGGGGFRGGGGGGGGFRGGGGGGGGRR